MKTTFVRFLSATLLACVSLQANAAVSPQKSVMRATQMGVPSQEMRLSEEAASYITMLRHITKDALNQPALAQVIESADNPESSVSPQTMADGVDQAVKLLEKNKSHIMPEYYEEAQKALSQCLTEAKKACACYPTPAPVPCVCPTPTAICPPQCPPCVNPCQVSGIINVGGVNSGVINQIGCNYTVRRIATVVPNADGTPSNMGVYSVRFNFPFCNPVAPVVFGSGTDPVLVNSANGSGFVFTADDNTIVSFVACPVT